MIITALLLTFFSGLAMASISMIVSRIAREKISFFQFYTVSNLLAGLTGWILFPDWSVAAGINWLPVLLVTGAIGLVNVMSQGAMICSFKWGHNGLSAAIRNASSMLTMFWGILILHEKISPVNFAGVILVILALAVIAVSGKKNSPSPDLKKWVPTIAASLLFSAFYQILFSCTALLPANVHNGGVLIPCLMTFCSFGNLLASLVERKVIPRRRRFYRFPVKVWRVMLLWLIMALVQYFLLVRAVVYMQKAGMAALTWPLLVGINVVSFSLFCRLKWKEKYPLPTVIAITGCVVGLILIIWGRK